MLSIATLELRPLVVLAIDNSIVCVCVRSYSPVQTLLYESGDPPKTVAVPDCGPGPQPAPADLPVSVGWPMEGKELPDPYSFQVAIGTRSPHVCV